MSYSDYIEDRFSEEQYDMVYKKIYHGLVEGKRPESEKCTIILGGQPGAGKSSFYAMREDLIDYIAVNGDEYRRFHPNYRNIAKTDPEHFTERTQAFSNKVVEDLIADLGRSGYSLIIEGTLRNPEVPIKTCRFLQEQGYAPELVVVACDAEKAWQSTIARARLQKERRMVPRLVPIDIYNSTVHQIPDSLETIERERCFSNITIIDRDQNILYKSGSVQPASEVLRAELNLENWDRLLPEYEEKFIREKIAILQESLRLKKEISHGIRF